MTQEAVVYSIDEKGLAVVEVARKSACGGECGSCKGCAHPEQMIRVGAVNNIGAVAGDRVIIESSTKKVFMSAYIAYIVPVVLMALFYFLPFETEGMKILSSFGGLAVGVGICYGYSKSLAARGDTRAVIKSILK